jgi:two-component system chemotaxis response regulator CheB
MPHSSQKARFESAGFDVVVVAASLGGPAVLRQILSSLPAGFPAPLLIVQHQSPRAPGLLYEVLAGKTRLGLKWARQHAPLHASSVYLAPPDRHLTVTRWRTARLSDGPRVNFARPAADLLLSSAARSFGPRALGVVLTGGLHDGANGAAAIREAGGVVIAQAPHTCRAPGMPEAAIRSGAVDFVLPPERISCALVSLVMVPGTRALFGVERLSA